MRDDIEVSSEMIDAGAEILWNNTSLDLGPSSSRDFAEQIIRRAFEIYRNQIAPAS
jgi:hypothetical protein